MWPFLPMTNHIPENRVAPESRQLVTGNNVGRNQMEPDHDPSSIKMM